VSHVYMPGTPAAYQAIQNVALEIRRGEFIAVIGHTGSGKSTLVQHFNGLLQPSTGYVTVDGQDIHAKGEQAKRARQKVGMVFQYPEHQLFEETVYEDIAFGPRNQGLAEAEITMRVKRAFQFVGLDFSQFEKRSPFQLSGGQMRRVAIAGVIAMEPEYLILDEPSAGLDPRGRDEIFRQIIHLHQETGIAVVLVSHNMEDVARMANRVIVMNRGAIVLEGVPRELFRNSRQELRESGVDVPPLTNLMDKLKEKGLVVDAGITTTKAAAEHIVAVLGGAKHAK
jgi:energy-coupling factor transport system ATP-binding protein